MQRSLLASAVVLALATPAFSQATVTTPAPGGGATVVVEPEQRTRIKRYVTERRVAPVKLRERVTVGATLPADVELREAPEDWGPEVRRYRYVYYDDNVYLVEPSSRRVVHVID